MSDRLSDRPDHHLGGHAVSAEVIGPGRRPAASVQLDRVAHRPAVNVSVDPRRAAPALVAGALALVYVIASPPSFDLAAHLFRAQLFRMEGFGIWNNLWYAGHDTPGYSVLFPPISAALTPQLAAALAATGSAALLEPLARRHCGADAWLGAVVFAAATATNLFTGRLAFAFGILPATAAVVALDCDRPAWAAALAALTALASPVAALVPALAGAAYAITAIHPKIGIAAAWTGPPQGRIAVAARVRPVQREIGAATTWVRPARAGLAVCFAALAPIGLLAVAFPEGGQEPFALSAFWPIPLVALGLLWAIPRHARWLRAALVLYALGTLASFLIASPAGSNVARLGTFAAAPLAVLVLWPHRRALLVLATLPLLYLEWHDPARDLTTAVGDPSAATGYYVPLLSFLERQDGPPFRIEIPFTAYHWEAYEVATRFPIARGWERQLDIRDNPLFYRGRLTAASYRAWLHRDAIRFVAVAHAPLDYSARAEVALIDRGLPYLRLVMRSAHWRVYAVADATPLVQGAATLTGLGPDSLTLTAERPGTVLVHVHFTPYWALSEGAGCVAPAGDLTALRLRSAGPVRLVIRFSLGRIGARSPRCS